MRSLAETRVVVGPQALIRYNDRLAVTVRGSPAPGISSGQALAAMDSVAASTLPAGILCELTRKPVCKSCGGGSGAASMGLGIEVTPIRCTPPITG